MVDNSVCSFGFQSGKSNNFRLQFLELRMKKLIFFLFFQLNENLEQWPHLSELVQCYHADFVKDDCKYGRYESVAPPSFQNQIFEGPDTDIETGNPTSL